MSEQQTLKQKTAKGLFWGGISNGVQQLLNMFFGICLARLLSPSDYGLVGMLYIFSLIASTLQESGFTAALVNKKNVKHADYNAVFWFSTLMGLILYVVLFFCAPLIADYYHQSKLTPLARFSFLGFVISSVGIAHNAYLFRNLKVKQNAMVSMLSLIVSGTIGIVMAFYGMAYWGLATQSIVFVTCTTVGRYCLSGFRPTLNIDFNPLRGMLSFSSKMLMTNIFTNINNNILSVILGRYYTPKEVGFYNQANKWNYMGFSTILGMINGVAQPVLHNVSDDGERQIRVFRKMLRFTSLIAFPCMFGLSLVAPQLITIAVTNKWAESAVLMQAICVGGAFLPLQNLYFNLILSKGRSDICLWNTIVFGILQIIVVLLCRNEGMQVMVKAYVAINMMWLLVWQYWAWKEIKLQLLQALRDVVPYATIAGICIVGAGLAASLFKNVYIVLAVKVLVAIVLYILLMYSSRSVTFRECMDYFLKRNRG